MSQPTQGYTTMIAECLQAVGIFIIVYLLCVFAMS